MKKLNINKSVLLNIIAFIWFMISYILDYSGLGIKNELDIILYVTPTLIISGLILMNILKETK